MRCSFIRRSSALRERRSIRRSGVVLLMLLVLDAAMLLVLGAGWNAPNPLRVGTSGDYAPFSLEAAAGRFEGLDADLTQRFAADFGVGVEFVRFRWPALTAFLAQDAFDVAASGVTMRPERALAGRYSRPYARTGAMLLIRDADTKRFPSAAALNSLGTRLVVNAGGHLERLARERFPRARLEAVADNLLLPELVMAARADAAMTDSAEIVRWRRPGLIALGPISTDYKALLLPANADELALRLDAWLVAREEDGWLNERRREWIGEIAAATPDAMGRRAVAALVGLRLGLMPAVAAAKRASGASVEDTTQEARVVARVRAASTVPDRAEVVYRQLIEMSKDVQRGTNHAEFAATLAELRDAIGRIDEQLVRELDRSTSADQREWLGTLSDALGAFGLDQTRLDTLAAALAGEPSGSNLPR